MQSSFRPWSEIRLEQAGPARLAGWFTHANDAAAYYDVPADVIVDGWRHPLTVRIVRDARGGRVADPEGLLKRIEALRG